MRLLSAELRKLARPLSWGVAGAAALFCVLLAVGGAHNAALAAGPTAGQVAGQLNPLAAGAEAAGLMASLPGALALALLAGAHIGGEWSGRTLKNVLAQHGRRWQVLAAKLVSLWLAGVALIAVCWAALVIAGPVLIRLDHLPAAHQTAAHALGLAAAQTGRALLVLAVFAAIGLLAGVVTRGSIGTTAAAAGAVICLLVLATLPGVARWTPATWVQAWMGFPAGQASITTLPSNFWSRFISAAGQPGHLAGLAGLAGLLAVCVLAALAVFSRSDVSG
jgi:ABC-type transport system involved in multi-copper enzyme maturation permease subunit